MSYIREKYIRKNEDLETKKEQSLVYKAESKYRVIKQQSEKGNLKLQYELTQCLVQFQIIRYGIYITNTTGH